MKRLIVFRLLLLAFVSFGAYRVFAQEEIKQVAIYVARGDGNQKMVSYAKFFASELQLAVSRSGKYNAVERTGRFLELLSKEQSYQRTGQVDESKIAELGRQEGVDFVLSVDMTDFGNNNIYVAWKLIDVKTAVVEDGDSELKEIVNMVADLKSFSEALTKRIVGGETSASWSSRYSSSGGNSTRGYGQPSSGSNYTETVFGIDMQMVYVEGGEFMMGCTSEQGTNCGDDEKPVHRVTLDSYYIGKFEVTQGQWEKVMGTSVYQLMPGWEETVSGVGPDYPMYYVGWEGAAAFCEELSQRTGKKYRLPTEAEWEYASRGGKYKLGTKYAGSDYIDDVAWFYGNSGKETHRVGTKNPNALGIYDMSGNVAEYCEDGYSSTYYSVSDLHNPSLSKEGRLTVVRGGAFRDHATSCRVTARYTTECTDCIRGFRVVCER